MAETLAIHVRWFSLLRKSSKSVESPFIYVCKRWNPNISQREFSVDGLNWINMPNTINVLGSRFALKIKTLKAEKHSLLLTQTQVAVGNSKGRLGSKYIQGKVDKACLEVLDRPATNEDDKKEIAVGLVAELASPYAVFLRG
jgi:hypothetical protein